MGIPLRIFGPKRLSYINTMTDVAPKSKSTVKPKAPASHPKYFEMVSAAIIQIGGPRGASRQAVLKYVCENYKVEPAKAAVQVKLCLKNGIEKGKKKIGAKKVAKSPGKVVKKTASKSPASKKVVKKTGKTVGKSPAKKASKPKAAPKKAAAKKV